MRARAGQITSLESLAPIELRNWGPSEGTDSRTAATLQAYFAAEHATVFRRLLCRRLAVLALGAWLLEAFTPLLPGVGLVMTVGLAGVAGIAAFIIELRAHGRLRALLGCQAP